MCNWHGVVCGLRGHRRGRVVALDLAELNLLGTIAPALGNLTHLRWLHLPWNRFHGILPSQLGNLQELTHLDLSLNSIGGQIPLSLSNCSCLVNILLHDNNLLGTIPSKFKSLHNLKVLELDYNKLMGTFPPEIGSFESLTVLNVAHNNLNGEIPAEIGKLVNLVTLSLSYNQLSGTIPTSIGNLSALTYLSTFSNNLIGNIPPLQGLSSLSVLHLGENSLAGRIPPSMGNISSLTAIDLYKNELVGQIPESLGNLDLLIYLGLDVNNLSGPIPHALGNLRSLEALFLNFNRLEGELPPTIFNLSYLESLVVSNNILNGSLPSDMTSNFPNLKNFSIQFNNFHGMVPSSLCNNSILVYLAITNNFLSGKIPQCLGVQQKNLIEVNLGGNQLKASKDADLGFLSGLTNSTYLMTLGNLSKHLSYFSMGNNKITGTIPEGIGDLVNLEYLSMGQNLLEGSIPTSISKISMLGRLYLQNNKLGNAFGGVIPSTLSSCPLEQLDLSNNVLEGRIPNELFLIPTLSVSMRISQNLLSGPLPSELGNLQNVASLDFSDNRISGEIPSSIGECQILEYLNISGNVLQGEIPSSLEKLNGLLVLDLSHNNLSGAIPEFLGTLRALSSLNLSFNKFEGKVPQDGIFLNATAISIIGDDGLCGGIAELKLPACNIFKKSSSKLIMIVSICSAIALITLVSALFTFYKRKQVTEAKLQASLQQYRRVSYGELVRVTNGFASENIIGAGSFGSVYKGILINTDQQEVVAVKVLNLSQRGASQSFIAECETLRSIRHRNLVRLLTVCSSIDHQGHEFKAIVYEFLPNGNLDKWLHQNFREDEEPLDLSSRLQIAIDVASSLEYLHQHKPFPIVHCDLKPSNVLLDTDMVAHVSDFGLARFLHQDLQQSNSWVTMRGTIGYAAPEYGLGNEVSIHGDVYSYGILLLEMFTGKRPTDSEFAEDLSLRKYVQMALPESVANILDQNLLQDGWDYDARITTSRGNKDIEISCITSTLHIGISCSADTPADRPRIRDALKELESIRDKLHKDLLLAGVPMSSNARGH
ncbi:hypothetical protein HU200_012644 [Digitaria exilis]|uniref:Receptor kinase-like protein Xa21 n=1 Tax=Digitaria exilis TaxID=1010633 RepID=A0A835KN41_9POAL|nr:hypothetical protein HU200_012644 [Digitaria exilis]